MWLSMTTLVMVDSTVSDSHAIGLPIGQLRNTFNGPKVSLHVCL